MSILNRITVMYPDKHSYKHTNIHKQIMQSKNKRQKRAIKAVSLFGYMNTKEMLEMKNYKTWRNIKTIFINVN